MSNLKKDIREEILDILRWPYNKRPVRLTQSEALRQQRATDILNLIESVVGEMEQRETEDMGLKSWTPEDYKAFGRNELRADIKSKLIDAPTKNKVGK